MTTARIAPPNATVLVPYRPDIEREIAALTDAIAQVPRLRARYAPRWLAIQLLEQDATIWEKVRGTDGGDRVFAVLEGSLSRLRHAYGEEIDLALTDQRYGFIHTLVGEVVRRPQGSAETMSDRIDRVVTHPSFGVPIFLVLMWVVFKMTTDVAGPFVDWIDAVIGGPITSWVAAVVGAAGWGGSWFESLVVDGVIAGVGGVLVFVPVLMALYLALAVLEDSGYMARAAFVMDRLMHPLGLHGRSFVPLMVGFGCTVPAFHATRTLEHERDRVLTGLLVPFMSCGGRLPVYALLATIFFPDMGGLVVWGIYVAGIVAAMGLGMVLKNTMFKDKERAPFIMELPPYRLPTLKNTWMLMWSRTSSFVKKAWTIIMAASVVLWFLVAIPVGGTEASAQVSTTSTNLERSLFATISRGVAPVFAPAGFGSWEASGALIVGLGAKEIVVSTMVQTYGMGSEGSESSEEQAAPTVVPLTEGVRTIVGGFGRAVLDAGRAIPGMVGLDLVGHERETRPASLVAGIRHGFEASSGGHGSLAALAFMVFVLLYTPCLAAVAAEWQELGTRWAWMSIVGQLVLAWAAATVIFQGGRVIGLG
ncbi:MAG: ferrous iron transport protein B [Chloroflexaceae bacterium]|nr:ferrous iron transport protein B [Chloroflexaceae bacterium]